MRNINILFWAVRTTLNAIKILARNTIELIKSLAVRGGPVLCWVKATSEGLFVVTDGRDTLCFHEYWHRFLYRRGIAKRIDALLSVYGVSNDYKFAPGDMVIDVGANIGEFAIGAARRGAIVHAFEPDPAVFPALKRNAMRYEKILPHQIALWNEDKIMELFSAPFHDDSSLIEPTVKVENVSKIAARSLDSFCAEHGIGNIALIKCEAEGAEPEVLEGAGEVLRRSSMVVVDVSPERRGESPCDAVVALLAKAGFQTKQFRYAGVDADIGIARRVVIGTRIL